MNWALSRRNFSKSDIAIISKAFKILYRRGLTLNEAMAELKPLVTICPPLHMLIDSLEKSTRGIVR